MQGVYDDILREQGFVEIGVLFYRFAMNIWWHPQFKIQIIHILVGSKYLLKGFKSYYLKSITEQGETWARDISPFQDYLEYHFREIHIAFSHFRDISQLQNQLMEKHLNEQNTNDLLSLDTGTSDLLLSYMRRRLRSLNKEKKELQEKMKKKKEQVNLFNNLQKEYQRKGSAACFNFTLNSNIQVAQSPLEFKDALDSIIKEIKDAHRYQVTQKLCGGRLNIHIAEADEPVLVWLEEWSGGALSPCQMERFKDGL